MANRIVVLKTQDEAKQYKFRLPIDEEDVRLLFNLSTVEFEDENHQQVQLDELRAGNTYYVKGKTYYSST